jgi:hypothetical protein
MRNIGPARCDVASRIVTMIWQRVSNPSRRTRRIAHTSQHGGLCAHATSMVCVRVGGNPGGGKHQQRWGQRPFRGARGRPSRCWPPFASWSQGSSSLPRMPQAPPLTPNRCYLISLSRHPLARLWSHREAIPSTRMAPAPASVLSPLSFSPPRSFFSRLQLSACRGQALKAKCLGRASTHSIMRCARICFALGKQVPQGIVVRRDRRDLWFC